WHRLLRPRDDLAQRLVTDIIDTFIIHIFKYIYRPFIPVFLSPPASPGRPPLDQRLRGTAPCASGTPRRCRNGPPSIESVRWLKLPDEVIIRWNTSVLLCSRRFCWAWFGY